MKIIFLIVIILLGLTSCTGAKFNLIDETSVVEKVAKSLNEKYKYFVVTEDYCYYTNKQYNVGDTLWIKK